MSSDRPNILYAEDMNIDRTLLSGMLQKQDYNLTTVGNGQEALNKLTENKTAFDLILMDIEMPEMDGMKTSSSIRNELYISNNDLPIIAITADTSHTLQGKALEVGIDDFLFKPFNQNELITMIQRWLNRDDFDSFSSAAKMYEQRDLHKFPLMEIAQIESFLEFVGLDRTREVLTEFSQHYEEKIDLIFDPKTDQETLAKELHTMASISGNVGLSRFSMACRHLMNDLKDGAETDALTRLMEIQSLYDNSLAKLTKVLQVMKDAS